MSLTHYVIFVCVVYLAIVLGRKSMKYDMRRRFASIEEGIELPNVNAVINYILKLRDIVAKLEHDYHTANNSLNISNAKVEKLERDYKLLMSQMKEKREECEALEKHLQTQKDLTTDINSNLVRIYEGFNSMMSELWKRVMAINDKACEHDASIVGYFNDMFKTRKKLIYITGLMNKTYLLSIGEVEVLKNGSLKYSLGSRSLGNYASKENEGWYSHLNPMGVLPLINPRDSKPIALITDYCDYKKLVNKFIEVNETSENIRRESAKTLDYMRGIKSKLEELVVIS